ncbi:MAG: GNAT family N-acetyltransferase [Chloroflexi bacterium]|nr:GNAT family N-acetyltransferase [Chloroflexota bacterium]
MEVQIRRMKEVSPAIVSQLDEILDEPWEVAQGEKFLANPDNALFLAFVGERVAGFLTGYRLQRLDKNRAEVLLYEIEVREEFRRQGIGKKLIGALNAWAAETGAFQTWVLTYSDNTAAMALYKSMDGEEDPPGTRMFTYYIDDTKGLEI